MVICMDNNEIFMLALAVGLVALIWCKYPDRISVLFQQIRDQSKSIIVSVPAGFIIAAFLSRLLPADLIGSFVGRESGFTGILFASVLGAFVPGGPMISFPIALTIWNTGAGEAQMVAFLTGWSVFAVHRIISYELPLMGIRFLCIRTFSSLLLPPLSGAIALLIAG